MQKVISKKEKEFLSVIYQHIRGTGFPPTFVEMKKKLGVSSNQSVLDVLKKLTDKRLIKRTRDIARSIVILPLGYKSLEKPSLVPFLGATSAGAPVDMLEVAGEWKVLPSENDKLEKLNSEVFLLRVYGDSMINAGINDGDVVLVKHDKEFISGDIVLAQIGEESTVKRFISDDKPPFIYLKPENPNYDIIPATEEMQLIGKIISIFNSGQWRLLKQ